MMGSGLSSDFMLLFILCIILFAQLLVSNVGNGNEPIVCNAVNFREAMQTVVDPHKDHLQKHTR